MASTPNPGTRNASMSDHDPSDADLSALAWVADEVRRSLEAAHKALRRYLREAESAGGSDLSSVDPSVLRQARAQLHQSVGALELVGLGLAAQPLRACENALHRMSTRPALLNAAAVQTIEKASFALLDFLSRKLAGKVVSPLSMFPQYRAVQELAGAARAHPADLWPHEWQWRPAPGDASVPARACDAHAIALFEIEMLGVLRAREGAYTRLSALCAELGNGSSGNLAALWQLASAFAEALSDGLVEFDVHAKRVASRLLAQLRAGDTGQASDRLAQDLLFFCAQAMPDDGRRAGPRLFAVRLAYGLDSEAPVDYEAASLGLFDPAQISQARKRLAAAKEVWSAVAGGELARISGLADPFSLVGESLKRLYPNGAVLAQSLQALVVHSQAQGVEPPADHAMEVATALLYMEASLEDAEFDHPEMAARVLRLANRLDDVRTGRSPGALELWMEQLYRQVSDRQTMGNVVQELRAALSEVEKQIDQYFRNPTQREVLIPVPGQLSSMRGVLSLLDLDHASQAVLRMRDDVDALANTEVDPQRAAQTGTFDRLADNLGALSFLIDMVSVQPHMAKTLFRFDPATGQLRAVMRRADRPSGFSGFDVLSTEQPALLEQAQTIALAAAQPRADALSLERELEQFSQQARAADQPDLADAARRAQATLARAVDADDVEQAGRELADSIQEFVNTKEASLIDLPEPSRPVPPPGPPAAPGQTGLEDDVEMREIFIEEAHEVIAAARAAVAELSGKPDDLPAQTVVRRAFHTLKGSGRMIGLNDLGEAAWACEQLYNARMADSLPADGDLRGFTLEALAHFEAWAHAIASASAQGFQAQPVILAADALRLERRRLPVGPAPAPLGAATSAAATAALTLIETLPPMATASLLDKVPDLPSLADLELSFDTLPLTPLAHVAPPAELLAPVLQPVLQPLLQPLAPVVIEDEAAIEPDFEIDFDQGTVPAALDALPDEIIELNLGALDLDLQDEASMAAAEHFEPDFGVPAAEVSFGADDAPQAAMALPSASVDTADLAHAATAPAGPVQHSDATALDAEAAATDDDQFKVIGDLRVGIALFNIFLNEADELSRRLCTDMAEWAHELQRPAGDNAVVLAHSLAGSSATVGFADLSQLARALELALMRSNTRHEGRVEDAALFGEAAQVIRDLLHQFAAGMLRSPEHSLLARLAAVPAALTEDLSGAPAASDASEIEVEPAFGRLGQPEIMPFVAQTEVAHRSGAPRMAAMGIDDDIDAEDVVDQELFEIFQEEASELIPLLHARLRDWADRPGDGEAASACMRTLHTLKGSARLAGAMRLGELAHRIESAVEGLSEDSSATGAEIEAIAAHTDTFEARYEALRRGESFGPGDRGAGQGVAGAAPVLAVLDAVAPVSLAALAPVAVPAEARPVAPAAAHHALAPAADAAASAIDWGRFAPATPADREATGRSPAAASAVASVRVRATLLDRLVNHAGEVSITRARIEGEVNQIRGALGDLTDNLERLRRQLRDIELQAETQIETRMEAARAAAQVFDPLEMDRFTRFQELTRMMAESVNDVATVQRGLQRTLQSAEDELVNQARLTRNLQDDLLRTRMVEFDGLSERLYRVVRQAAKETGKQVRLDISGGNIEVDRGVLDRMTGAFEHLLRNSVVHGIEAPAQRLAAGKDATGTIVVSAKHEGNEVAIDFRDDGAGLALERIRAKAVAMGLLPATGEATQAELAALIFQAGFSTAAEVTGLAGRGVGMDVVRADVNAMGGRIETATAAGQGTSFRLVLPLTTAVTQVVMMRCANLIVAVPSALVELVKRVPSHTVAGLYEHGSYLHDGTALAFHWLAALLQGTALGASSGRTAPLVIIRSAAQRIAVHVDEVIGNQEVVVKNLGPQLSRLPGLAGMTLLPSGIPALIYNPVALATLYGQAARAATLAAMAAARQSSKGEGPTATVALAPLVLVVDDSLTVRRVTQRLLTREGYRVGLAKDGLDALERLADERPAVVITDIEMPRMDGFDLVRNMQSDSRLKDLPVIMITSRIAQKHRDYAAELGVKHYLGKPYVEDDLLALVARYTEPLTTP